MAGWRGSLLPHAAEVPIQPRELKTGLAEPDRAMLPGCLVLPRSETRDLLGILCSSG